MTAVAIYCGMTECERERGVIEYGGLPSRVGRMTKDAVCRNAGGLVIGIRSRIVGCQMTGDTFHRESREITVNMTFAAVDGMAQRQREEGMVRIGSRPADTVYRMAEDAVGGITALLVVGCRRGIIKILVAVKTFHTGRVKAKQRCGWVALQAIGCGMYANKREPALAVELDDVIDHPGTGCMTPSAIGSHGLVVNVGMAIHTGSFRLREYQCGMTRSAVELNMLTCKRKNCLPVIKGIDFLIELPPFGAVANIATDLKILSMRGWIGHGCCHCHQRHEQQD
jgi:hypothetical protein